MARQRYGNRNSRYKRNPGLERALQHIEEAKRLSVQLGGTDEDVKRYFFALDPVGLSRVLDAYEREHGKVRREYAERTLPDWRSGHRKMSGEVAGRLFSLLPGFMPIQKKYDLVKSLWEAKCPHTQKTFCIGPNADEQDVCNLVREHLLAVVQEYEIPDEISRRFKWLAQEDVALQQQLYNYFLQLNRDIVALAADDRVPSLLRQLRASSLVQRLTQSIRVGNHQIILVLDPKFSGVSTERPLSPTGSTGCLLVIAAFTALIAGIASACAYAGL